MLRDSLEEFLGAIPMQELAENISSASHMSVLEALGLIETYSNEARVSLRVVEKYLGKDKRILEVGAGLCLFSVFLKKQEFDITALEPAAGGFDDFYSFKNIILEYFSCEDLFVIENEIENLICNKKEKFDLIFSNNVLEHIPRLKESIGAMVRSLNTDGEMVHACPNYIIPYEPHLQIPVLKCCKKLSYILFKKKIKNNIKLWNSINFISHRDVKKLARENNVKVNFNRGIMYDSFARLDSDPIYANRQSNVFIKYLWSILKITKTHNSLKYLPVCMSTPMVFVINKK